MTVLVAAASKHGATDEIAERMSVRMARASEGDHRDWQAIDDWAAAIAVELQHEPAARNSP